LRLSRNPLKLGIVYENNQIVSHRSLLKILLNPYLRLFGWQIGSVMGDNKTIKTRLVRCPKTGLKYSFVYDDSDAVIRQKRMLY
jgi:hypothetical protein